MFFFSVMTRAAFSKQDGMYDVPDRFIDYKFQRLSIESWWFLPNVIRDNVFTVYSGCWVIEDLMMDFLGIGSKLA